MAAVMQLNQTTAEGIPEQQVLQWYAVRTRSNFEKKVQTSLCGKNYETYLPLYRQKSRRRDRVTTFELVVFPGYVFCRLDVRRRVPVMATPGVVSIVGFGGAFIPVSAREIATLQRVIHSGLSVEMVPYLSSGGRIRISGGVLKGIEGFLVKTKSNSRVVVSVDLLRRSVAVELDRNSIEGLDSNESSNFLHGNVMQECYLNGKERSAVEV